MPWKKVTEMSSKLEFIKFAIQESCPFTTLCKRFNISTKTGYKYLKRYHEHGEAGLEEQSRRPHSSPKQTWTTTEDKIIAVRLRKKTWGGKKIHAFLNDNGVIDVPAPSTITDILKRNGLIQKKDQPKNAHKRYEHEKPNDLWQVDFKGHFAIHDGRCHPLTMIDDHSRFLLGLRACGNEKGDVVKSHFKEIFSNYGLPYRINFDNGTPWASVTSRYNRFTELSLWLVRLGIKVTYSRIRRPQTNGKLERLHRTLKDELLQYHYFYNLTEAQKHFDKWRTEYNVERPHEAINMRPPISRYQPSMRPYPQSLPEIVYRPGDIIRKVDKVGKISYQNRDIFLGEGLRGMPIALREDEDSNFNVYFCDQRIASINLRTL